MHGEHLHEPGEGSRAGRRDAQRPVASRRSTPPPGTRQNRQNLVLAIWSVTWGAAGSGVLERLRANPAQLLEALERALHETQGSVRLVHSWRYTPRAR